MTTPREVACRELVELLTEYLEGAQPPDEVTAVDAHLDQCPACRDYLTQMRATITTLGGVPVETLSAEAVDTLLAALRLAPLTARLLGIPADRWPSGSRLSAGAASV